MRRFNYRYFFKIEDLPFKIALMKFPYFSAPRPRFFGHRGAAGHAPENTLHSFEVAARQLAYIETDAWLTEDGVPVFLHDESLLRTCGVDKKISEVKWTELQDYDAGYTFTLDGGKTYPFRGQDHRVPSVEDILQEFPDKFFNIEIKDAHPDAPKKILEVMAISDALERVLLAAEHDNIMQRIRSVKPKIVPTGAAYNEVYGFLMWLEKGAPRGEYTTGAQAFQIPHEWEGHDLGKPEIIAMLHSMNIEVHYWTINDAATVRRLLDNGADGIVSDLPELARDF